MSAVHIARSEATGGQRPSGALVGRWRELAELERLLMGSRLVTLIGDPGVGKSRLARELAARGLPGNGGAYLVRLARVEDERPVTQAIVLALAIGEDRGRGAATSVRAQMRDRPLLLVLDDCERVRDGCAGLARSLLAACAKLTVLATSRQPLAVPGERLWRVPPLAIPAPGEDRLEALEGSDAVALFCDRAAAATGAGAGAGAGFIAHLRDRLGRRRGLSFTGGQSAGDRVGRGVGRGVDTGADPGGAPGAYPPGPRGLWGAGEARAPLSGVGDLVEL